MLRTWLFEFDGVSALTGIGLLCGSYLAAHRLTCVASWLRRRGHSGSGMQGARAARTARLLGSAGVVLACVSPVTALGAKGGGRPGDASRTAAAPPWDSAPPAENAPNSRAGGPSVDRPWESERHLLRATRGTPHRSAESSAPPWSGDGSSPPRPSRRTGAAADSQREARDDEAGARREDRGAHRGPDHESPVSVRGAHSPDKNDASGARTQEGIRRTWTVRGGDTLWDIAAHVLGTSDQARIARYWPAIHRANRATIGADPSLIFPGQSLRLPMEGLDQ